MTSITTYAPHLGAAHTEGAPPRLIMRRYRSGDFAEVDPTPDHIEEHALAAPSWRHKADRPPGLAWTLLHGETRIACAGLIEYPGRQFAVWAWLSVMTRREWAFATACARIVLRFAETDLEAAQVSAWCRVDRPEAKRYLERLGFEYVADRFDGALSLREMVRTRSATWTR